MSSVQNRDYLTTPNGFVHAAKHLNFAYHGSQTLFTLRYKTICLPLGKERIRRPEAFIKRSYLTSSSSLNVGSVACKFVKLTLQVTLDSMFLYRTEQGAERWNEVPRPEKVPREKLLKVVGVAELLRNSCTFETVTGSVSGIISWTAEYKLSVTLSIYWSRLLVAGPLSGK